MTLPPLPEPAMVYINGTHQLTRCHNETQLIEYGELCAEKMREACADLILTADLSCINGDRALQLYTAELLHTFGKCIKLLEIEV